MHYQLNMIWYLLCYFFVCSSVEAQPTTSIGQTNDKLIPILRGDYADPSIMRDGNDYYMTHSSFDYLPGLTVLHSTDLLHWTPVSYALKERLGSVWAPFKEEKIELAESKPLYLPVNIIYILL